MRSSWGFAIAGNLTFGRGAVEELPRLLARIGCRRILIVTDPVLQQIGHVDRVVAALQSITSDVVLWAAGRAEPSIADALDCIATAREVQPDLIVGLGGGSNIDLAKITATVLAHGGSPQDYFGFDRIPGPTTPVAAIPTTAGTGSEVSHSAVLTDTDAAVKVSTLSQHLRPALAIVDPSLTDSCPRSVTADSGIDALVHAVEAYTARRFDEMIDSPAEAMAYQGAHPLGKLIAGEAIRLVGRHLVCAVRQPDSAADRDGMALAATYAGMAFSNCGVALVHGLEYPLGALVHCSHGAGNGTLLPYVMQFNLPARVAEISQIGELLGVDKAALSLDEHADATIQAIFELRRTIGIPDRLREYGAKQDQLATIAEKTSQIERLMTLNPRRASRDDLLAILQAAF